MVISVDGPECNRVLQEAERAAAATRIMDIPVETSGLFAGSLPRCQREEMAFLLCSWVTSYKVSVGMICGFGPYGYLMAIDAMVHHLSA